MLLENWSRSLLLTMSLALPAWSMAQVSLNISVGFPPPELPVYEQPPIPAEGYIWTPGYWSWGEDIEDYYWVPGTWVMAPQPEYLWTPGYWAADNEAFYWHSGYWGPLVGFYGGVNYGYGYGGRGYEGGYWRDGRMYYNRSVNNIRETNITNVYNRTVINNVTETRVSYNGGNGGVRAQPSSSDRAAEHERHIPVTQMQAQHIQAARSNPELRASQNRGVPPIAATPRPAAFSSPGVVQASRGNPSSVVHASPQPRQAQPASRTAQPTQNPGPAAEFRNAQPESRAAQPQNRPAQPEYRTVQPEHRTAQPEYRTAQPEYRAAQPEHRTPQPEYRAPPPQYQQRGAPEQAPPARQYEQPRAAPAPQPPARQAAPPPPPPQRQAAPPPPPRPAEHPQARTDEHDRH